MPTRRMLTEMQSIVDELYPSTFMLQQAKKNGEHIGTLVTLATRVKIYHGCYDLIKMYKENKCVCQETLQRTLNRIKLHRYQLKRMNKKSYADNHKYLIGLAALLHVSFT
jgi:hypothetical protein